jgi:hypothetical protein
VRYRLLGGRMMDLPNTSWELVIHTRKEEIEDCTDVVLSEATNRMYIWVAVNSASAGKAASSHQR